MKKMITIMAMAVVLTAGFAVADDVKINIDNDATATAEQQQDQQQQQGQQQQQSANAAIYGGNDLREHTVALPGITGNLMNVSPILADGRWHTLLCDQYTVEELQNMKSSSSYVNREGFFLVNLFTSPVERTLRVKKYSGKIENNSVVRLVPDHSGNRVVAEYEGSGAKGIPLSAMVAYAGLEGVYDTGEYAMVVNYRTRDIASLSGVGVGSGAAAAVSSENSVRSGAMSVGAIVGFSEAYTKYVYDIKVKVVKASREALYLAQCLPPPQVVKEEPKKEEPVVKPAPLVCNPSEYLREKAALEARIAVCYRYSYDNFVDRAKAAKKSFEAYLCTGDKKYLEDAIEHYQMAELNHIHGFDIKNHVNSASIIAEVEYWLASAFYARDGSIEGFWSPPKFVKHESKKTGNDKWVPTTAYEKREIMKLRNSLERYSTKPVL